MESAMPETGDRPVRTVRYVRRRSDREDQPLPLAAQRRRLEQAVRTLPNWHVVIRGDRGDALV
jgi:hypothetical protein